jgi:hypothetical protein
MGLDFYIANSKDIVNAKKMLSTKDDFAILSEELQGYLYYNKKVNGFNISCLIDIDPYYDTILEGDKIYQIMKVCESILESDFLQRFENINDAINTFIQLKDICKKAIEDDKNIIAVGD